MDDKLQSSSTVDERMHHFADFMLERFIIDRGIRQMTKDQLLTDYLEWEHENFPLGSEGITAAHCQCLGVDMTDISKNKAGVYYHVMCNKPMYDGK